MRPVRKKNVGEEVSYENSNGEMITVGILAEYLQYSEAKGPLVACIDQYCSYCESRKDFGDLAVEHIAARSQGGAETDWDNFLLACNICNSYKGAKLASVRDSYWPHLNNTYFSFKYDCSGRVIVNPNLKGEARSKAQKLYEICQLGCVPGAMKSPSKADFRWRRRVEVWDKAKRDLDLYKQEIYDVEDVLKDALLCGFWSIWFTVFNGIDEVRCSLIERFKGTDESCFDENNHFEPILRDTDK